MLRVSNSIFLAVVLLLQRSVQTGAFVPSSTTTTRTAPATIVKRSRSSLVSLPASSSSAPTKDDVASSKDQDHEEQDDEQKQRSSRLAQEKKTLFRLLRTEPQVDPVLVDPFTREPLRIVTQSAVLGERPYQKNRILLQSKSNTYAGSTDLFLNLLEPVDNTSFAAASGATLLDPSFYYNNNRRRNAWRNILTPWIPPPLRSAWANGGDGDEEDDEYIPMRDLFTSPAVSFAYERGWRQGFAQAGFPGPDLEANMAMQYFDGIHIRTKSDKDKDKNKGDQKRRKQDNDDDEHSHKQEQQQQQQKSEQDDMRVQEDHAHNNTWNETDMKQQQQPQQQWNQSMASSNTNTSSSSQAHNTTTASTTNGRTKLERDRERAKHRLDPRHRSSSSNNTTQANSNNMTQSMNATTGSSSSTNTTTTNNSHYDQHMKDAKHDQKQQKESPMEPKPQQQQKVGSERPSRPVLMDMSCGTGLFTRRFAATGKYERILACDYSASMLQEAQRRIRTDRALQRRNSPPRSVDAKLHKKPPTPIELIQCDVARIPAGDETIDALHAGAAMHCWPDLYAALTEVHRVLKPGGRYFATTFLSTYFGTLMQQQERFNNRMNQYRARRNSMNNNNNNMNSETMVSRQAYQYFGSIEQIRQLLLDAGFARDKILVEIVGNACIIIRCEK